MCTTESAAMIGGCMTALATPFSLHGIDERTFADHANWQIVQGCTALVTATATGEAPTLADAERNRVTAIAIDVAHRRTPVIAGIVANSTERAITQAKAAERAGAAAILLSLPFYNKPTQDGLFRHIDEVSRAADIPIFVHDDPVRTNLPLAPATVERLLQHRAIAGFVDGSIASRHGSLAEDGGAPVLIGGGRVGTLSVAANVTPRLCASLDAERKAGSRRATESQLKLRPLLDALDLETDPSPVKYALFLVRHHFSPAVRLPLVEVCGHTARMIAAALAALRDEVDFQP